MGGKPILVSHRLPFSLWPHYGCKYFHRQYTPLLTDSNNEKSQFENIDTGMYASLSICMIGIAEPMAYVIAPELENMPSSKLEEAKEKNEISLL